MTTLFMAYSHKDEELRNELETHLAALKHQGRIEAWHDRRIVAGRDWNEEISQNLETAEVILLLVSSDFLASPYCYGVETQRALERHQEGSAKVIPVILRPCDWTDLPIGRLQAAPTDGKPVTTWPSQDKAFVDVVHRIKDALPEHPSENEMASRTETTVPYETVNDDSPRSSNLRLRKTFTQRDKDRFLVDGFGFIERFFQNSLKELEKRNTAIETFVEESGNLAFSATIYQNGEKVESCTVGRRAEFGSSGIFYSEGLRGFHSGFNEILSVGNDEHKLFFQATLGDSIFQNASTKLSPTGAAEYLWGRFISRLQ